MEIRCDVAIGSSYIILKNTFIHFFPHILKVSVIKVNNKESSNSDLNLSHKVFHHNMKLEKPIGLGV